MIDSGRRRNAVSVAGGNLRAEAGIRLYLIEMIETHSDSDPPQAGHSPPLRLILTEMMRESVVTENMLGRVVTIVEDEIKEIIFTVCNCYYILLDSFSQFYL